MRSWQENSDIRQFDTFSKTGGGYEPIFNTRYAEAYELSSASRKTGLEVLVVKDTQAATAIALRYYVAIGRRTV